MDQIDNFKIEAHEPRKIFKDVTTLRSVDLHMRCHSIISLIGTLGVQK